MAINKKLDVVFAPGCFDDFDGTQEELDQLIVDLMASAATGYLPVINLNDLAEDDPLMLNYLESQFRINNRKTLQ